MPRTTDKEWDPNDDDGDEPREWSPEDEEWRPDDDFGSPDDDPKGPGEHDRRFTDGKEPDFVSCPSCGKQIMAGVEKCSYCGEWFTREAWHSQVAGKGVLPRRWVIVGVIIVIAVIALSIVFPGGWYDRS